jgi:hypothetical protein
MKRTTRLRVEESRGLGVKSEPAAIIAFSSELSAAVLSFGERQVVVSASYLEMTSLVSFHRLVINLRSDFLHRKRAHRRDRDSHSAWSAKPEHPADGLASRIEARHCWCCGWTRWCANRVALNGATASRRQADRSSDLCRCRPSSHRCRSACLLYSGAARGARRSAGRAAARVTACADEF